MGEGDCVCARLRVGLKESENMEGFELRKSVKEWLWERNDRGYERGGENFIIDSHLFFENNPYSNGAEM